MDKNSFKENLQVKQNVQEPNNSGLDGLLKELGLFPLPENIDITISEDNKYLNLKLKQEETENEQDETRHLKFQLLLKPKNLSALEKSDDYQDLLDRYHRYTKEYIDDIQKYAVDERNFLKEKFPELVFSIKIRIKSIESYMDKINKHISEGKSTDINDIMAERIVLTSYKDSYDEKLLTDMCYKVAQALYDFRINTPFRMKPDNENNSAKTDKEYITKDYIEHPKENGYQSLHLLMNNKYNPDFSYETQIRTLSMEAASKSNPKVSHKDYKPRVLNDSSATRIPTYYIVTPFDDDHGNSIIYVPFKDSFYHFYNDIIKNFKNPNITTTITYEKYRQEMFEITDALGLSFKDIREKLRHIDVSKYLTDKTNDEFETLESEESKDNKDKDNNNENDIDNKENPDEKNNSDVSRE